MLQLGCITSLKWDLYIEYVLLVWFVHVDINFTYILQQDLAARNVMVSEDEICKVGDFGLLRELPKDDKIYVAKSQVAFPIRWMAPESLMRREFSPASDVWSFGILMWEMHNPRKLPYGKNMDNTQVAVGHSRGLPTYCGKNNESLLAAISIKAPKFFAHCISTCEGLFWR